jgi:hypothetical protein
MVLDQMALSITKLTPHLLNKAPQKRFACESLVKVIHNLDPNAGALAVKWPFSRVAPKNHRSTSLHVLVLPLAAKAAPQLTLHTKMSLVHMSRVSSIQDMTDPTDSRSIQTPFRPQFMPEVSVNYRRKGRRLNNCFLEFTHKRKKMVSDLLHLLRQIP